VEARTEFRGEGISKSLVVVVAVSITMALGVGAGVAAKNLSLTAAPKTHISQGLGGAAQENAARRGGLQIVGGNSAPAAAVGPDDRQTTTKPALSNSLQADTRGIIPAEAFGPSAQLAPNSFLGPDAQERNAQLAAQARPTKAHGYI